MERDQIEKLCLNHAYKYRSLWKTIKNLRHTICACALLIATFISVFTCHGGSVMKN